VFSSSARILSVLKNAVSSGATRLIGIGVSLAMVPMTLSYLGADTYGVWMVVSSIIALLQLTDMGIGNALIGLTARYVADKHRDAYKDLLVSALVVLSAMAILLWLFSLLLIPFLDIGWFFGSQAQASAVMVRRAMYAFTGMFCIGLPLTAAQSVRLGLLQGHRNGFYNSAGQLINLAAVYGAICIRGELFLLIVASMTGTVFFNALNTAQLLLQRGASQFVLERIRSSGRAILRAGSLFFALQILGVISYNLDSLIVSHYLGSASVSIYSVCMKVFSVPGMIQTLFFSGLWSAYAQAQQNQDWGWIAKTYKRVLAGGVGCSILMALVLFGLSPWIIRVLTKNQLVAQTPLLWGMAVWASLSGLSGAVASLLNGLHALKIQIYSATVAMLLNIVISIELTKLVGVSGPIWGTGISQMVTYPFVIVFTLKYLRARVSANEIHAQPNV
jgi:O-antigen/teichoic acid export membrane protein